MISQTKRLRDQILDSHAEAPVSPIARGNYRGGQIDHLAHKIAQRAR